MIQRNWSIGLVVPLIRNARGTTEAVEIFWNEDVCEWVSKVAKKHWIHYSEPRTYVIKQTIKDMKDNHNNYYGDATKIRIFTKEGNLTKTISIR
jgi:hypothetical protein